MCNRGGLMFKSYEEYVEKKLKIEEQLADKAKVGTRYIASYSDIMPSEIREYHDCKERLREQQNKYFRKQTSYLEAIADYNTILEYLGDGVYQDLLTGYYILNSTSDDLRKCLEAPFAWIRESNELANQNIDELTYTDEEKRLICDEVNVKAYEQLNYLYSNLLQDEETTEEEKSQLHEQSALLEQDRIGTKYAITYESLEPTISDDLASYKLRDTTVTHQYSYYYTIIEYLGNGLYRDLTTGIIYQDKQVEIKLHQEGERTDYTRFNQEELNQALEHPIIISTQNLNVITDNILLSVWNKTYPKREEITQRLEQINVDLQERYQRKCKALQQEEFRKQYKKAEIELQEHLKEQERQKELAAVRKVYQLK